MSGLGLGGWGVNLYQSFSRPVAQRASFPRHKWDGRTNRYYYCSFKKPMFLSFGTSQGKATAIWKWVRCEICIGNTFPDVFEGQKNWPLKVKRLTHIRIVTQYVLKTHFMWYLNCQIICFHNYYLVVLVVFTNFQSLTIWNPKVQLERQER